MAKKKAKQGFKGTPGDQSTAGKALVAKRGPEYMAELGRRSAAKRDPDQYARMARASAKTRREIYAAGREAIARRGR